MGPFEFGVPPGRFYVALANGAASSNVTVRDGRTAHVMLVPGKHGEKPAFRNRRNQLQVLAEMIQPAMGRQKQQPVPEFQELREALKRGIDAGE